MTLDPAAVRRLPLAGVAALATACLCACAGTPKPAPSPPPVPQAAAPPPVTTMAPIANPEPQAPARREPARPRTPEAAAPRRSAPVRPVQDAPPPPGAPTTDRPLAARLRVRGLEELDRGAVTKAVALLTQASRLDPDNALIRRDLARAERINRAVRSPH